MEQEMEYDKKPTYYRYWGKARTRLEVDYRSGKLGDAEICGKHSISKSELGRRINYNGWEKLAAGETLAGYHLLPYHCLDVAAVGQVLLDKHAYFLQTLECATQVPAQQLKPWLLFMLSLHDIGKFSEAFQQMRPEYREAWWGEIKIKNYDLRHDSLGYVLWSDEKTGIRSGDGLGFKSIDGGISPQVYRKLLSPCLQSVCGHHGVPPLCAAGTRRAKNYFRSFDVDAARLFVDEMAELFRPDMDNLFSLSKDRDWRTAQKNASWLVAGFTVLCDWLGSNRDLFDYCDEPVSLEEYWHAVALPGAENAIKLAGLLPAKSSKQKSITDLFEKIKQATPLQKQCDEMPLASTPQLFILEDVTGAGKTEAAITLVHRLMSQQLAEGLFVALPTMATANAMYERMAEVYRKLYADEETPSLILSHSARHLSKLFQKSLFDQTTTDVNYAKGEETASVQCARWLSDHRKKALLADVSIGTIDQALLGILPARHQSLRLYGLSNKVLLVDEVHAYDHYMFPLLKTLIQFHASFGGSVILLSATLPMSMRQELVSAFQLGRGETKRLLQSTSYPLLTHLQEGKEPSEIPLATRKEVQRYVAVKLLHQEEDVLKVIKTAVEEGRCICWVRNTVHDARQAYEVLAKQPWVNRDRLGLFHSRYVLGDRLQIEKEALDNFGDESGQSDRCGRILVATQVIEQSLDMDADLFISDLAPIDLLIQRAGRLHRHVRFANGDRNYSEQAEDQRPQPVLYVLTPSLEDEPGMEWYKSLFPKGVYVYPHTGMLWNTAKLLKKRGGWNMPDDARDLIEGVYSDEAEAVPDTLAKASEEAEGEWWASKSLANFNTLKLETGYSLENAWDDEARIPTRLAEDSVTIYLAQWDGKRLTPLVNEGRYPWDLSSLNVAAKKIGGLPENTPGYQAIDVLKEAERLFDEFSLIVPMVWDGEVWRSTVLGINDDTIDIAYLKGVGLLLGEEIVRYTGNKETA